MKRLAIDEKHLLRDEKNVVEEREELNSTIGEQTIEAESLKAKALQNLAEVEEEVSDEERIDELE